MNLGILIAACWVTWTAAVAAQAPAPADGGAKLRSVSIAFDTSARSSPATGPFPLSVSIEGLRGTERIPLADGTDLRVERDVAVPAVFELPVRQPIAKDDLDQVVTKLTSESPAGRFVFHYTLTLTFEGAGVTSTVRQKVYAVTLSAASPLAMTQTSARESPSSANAVERAYAELAATYARLEEAIEGNRPDVPSFQAEDFSAVDFQGRRLSTEYMATRNRQMQQNIRPPIWSHHVLGNLRLDQDQAVITVRQAYSRMQLVNAKLRKVETSVTQDETWMRTPDGWKRRFVENETDMEWFVDGERVEPGKPYDENAPPYEPPPWSPPP